jgi:hypothetical protein
MTGLIEALAVAPGAEAGTPEGLLMTAGAVQQRLRQAFASRDWLDAFLLTAGLWQIVEDRLHPDPARLRQAAEYLRPRSAPLARAADLLAGAGTLAAARHRDLVTASAELVGRATELAGVILTPDAPPARRFEPVLTPRLLALVGDEPLRLPAGFTGFDQYPGDIRELSRRFLARGSPPGSVCVLGVRTSGNYYAPLCAAALHQASGITADVMSYRPTRPLGADERSRIRAVVRRHGRILVIDDPPGSGSAVAAAAAAAMAAGAPRTSITLLLPLFEDDLPAALSPWDHVLLPWDEWEIHARIAAAPAAVARLVDPAWQVQDARRTDTVARRTGRAHARARLRVNLASFDTGQRTTRDVLVEGAGLGLFGRQAMVAGALREHLPSIYGFADGLLFTEYLAVGVGDGENDSLPAADDVARYVAARAAALPIAGDPTARMRGRQPAWQVAARHLSRPFGPLAPLAGVALGRICRELTRTAHPCVVDGDMRPGLWRAAPDGTIRKTGFSGGTYSHFDALCFDPVFDLAGAAGSADRAYQTALREAYGARSGRPVDAERWLLHRLVHAWRQGQAGEVEPAGVVRRQALAMCDYLAEIFLDGLPDDDRGGLCAIDLDGVLESDRFGFPAPTPAGMMALRALRSHGYRPVLASGRSIAEVRERCRSFGLAGGVAEYGAALYERATGACTDLRGPRDRSLLAATRAELAAAPGVVLDPAYRHIIRVRRHGSRLALPSLVPDARWRDLRLIEGERQTDVLTPAIDKAHALQKLATHLGHSGYALAVGDGEADEAMLKYARLGVVPANAAPALRRAHITVTRHGYQRGLQEACALLIGHLPGSCPTCRSPELGRRTRALLTVLAAPEPQPGGLAGAAARIGACVMAGFLDKDAEP